VLLGRTNGIQRKIWIVVLQVPTDIQLHAYRAQHQRLLDIVLSRA
jgi:hypothetical protein